MCGGLSKPPGRVENPPHMPLFFSSPGALPQADIVRTFGALCPDENCYLHNLLRAEGPIYTSLGQRPRNGDNGAIKG